MGKTTNSKKTNRLQNHLLRLLSILGVIFSVGLFLLGLYDGVFIIPFSILAISIMLWRYPVFWTWIEELFSRRPKTTWARFSMNLIVATLIATILEDVLDFFWVGIRFLLDILRR